MANKDVGYDKTVRVVREERGHSHFARHSTTRERLPKPPALPALWALAVVVVAAVIWW
jgi:hypothetical protein